MTLAEIKGFLNALHRQKSAQQVSFILGVAVGSQGDKKSITRAIKDLTEHVESNAQKPVKLTSDVE